MRLLRSCAPAVLDEARLLGLLANNALTDLGRALAGLTARPGDENDDAVPMVEHDPMLAEAATRALASVRRSALFGPDLTAVVTGPPSAELAALLDRTAERESRGAASVWRFTTESVRRALDQGYEADTLLDELAAVGTIPQPLEYLVRDTARRHGEVTVTTVGCVVQATDTALLAEIAAHRRLGRLGLRLLAPTVLVSRAPADRTLSALREVGYSPVPVSDTGEITIHRARPEEPAGGKLILLPGGQVAELSDFPGIIETPPLHAGRARARPVRARPQAARRRPARGRQERPHLGHHRPHGHPAADRAAVAARVRGRSRRAGRHHARRRADGHDQPWRAQGRRARRLVRGGGRLPGVPARRDRRGAGAY
ncbi:hypothetical protein GCM10020001_078910 [Nonomuraea salmonea]